MRPPPSARREMVRLIIGNLPCSHGKKTLAIIAQRIVAKYLTGLCCFMFLVEHNNLYIQHNATDHAPSTVRFNMYMIVEFPSSSEIAIIPIEWMVGKSKTHALWTPYDSGKAGLDCINNE